jgi:protein-tyrosine phosphatase
MSHSYHALVNGSIFFGGAKDVKEMVETEGVEVVVDLREEADGCAYSQPGLQWIKVPLGDDANEPQAELFKQAIAHVVNAHKEGKKVAFHCGGGKGRTGAVAVGTLMELGLANTLEEAEAKVKSIRPIINVKPAQWEALKKLYEK